MRSTLLVITALLLTACGLAMSNEDRLDRGEEAFASGDFRAAIIDAKDVLRDEPSNSRGRVLLGRASAAVGDGASAEKELRRAIELGVAMNEIVVPLARGLLLQRKFQDVIDDIQPNLAVTPDDEADLKLIRGDAFMGLQQPAVARELYNDILLVDSQNLGAHLGVAASYRAEGNFSEARRVLDHITSTFPNDVRGWLSSGELNFGMRSFASAADDYEAAIQLAADGQNAVAEVQAFSGLAETQFALQQIDEARTSVAHVVELAPDSMQALYLTSRVAYLDEDWNTAQQNLQRILTAAPDYRPAQTLLGAVHLQSGNLSQAEMYLSTVLAANPENAQARRMLAETRLQQRDVNEAEATLAPLVSSEEPELADLAMAARASFGQGDIDAAIDFLKQGVAEDPSNTDIKFQLAIALMNAGRDMELSELLDEIDVGASRQDEFRRDMLSAMSEARFGGLDKGLLSAQLLADEWPKNPNAHNLLGSILLARGDLVAARSSFETAIELQPGDPTAQRNIAMIDERHGDLSAAQSRYELVLEGQPNATWAMFGLARLAARNGDIDTSQEWLQRIRSIDANAVNPRLALAKMLIARSAFSEAETVVDEVLRIRDDIPEPHNLLGRVRAAQDDDAGASAAFEKALELSPDNEQYRLDLAKAQQRAGNMGLAQETLLQGGNVNLDDIPAAVTLASLKVESGDLDGAMKIARDLQARHPASPIPIALEAEIHVRGGRLNDAARAYDRALAIDVMRNHAIRAHRVRSELGRDDRLEPLQAWLVKQPDDSVVRMVLAESLQSAGRIDESIAEYSLVSEQDPENGVALNNLAWTYYLARDDRATETARKAFALMPDSGAVADTLGWILVETGEIDEGVSVLQKAVELSNGRTEVRYHYAVGLARSGNEDEARRILQDVVANGGEFASRKDAERLLADL